MLITIAAEFRESTLLKLLSLDEVTGESVITFIDSRDEETLKDYQQKLEEGVTFADFQIVEFTGEDKKPRRELRHLCTNLAPGDPESSHEGFEIVDPPSLTGLLRKLITSRANVIINERADLTGILNRWDVASVNTIQFGDDMGMRVSSLIPYNEEGHTDAWRWISTPLISNNSKDEMTSPDHLRFLVSNDLQLGEYEQFVVDYGNVKLANAVDGHAEYKCIGVTKDLNVYPNKSNLLMTPAIISRLKFSAESYKLALYSLTQGLFPERKIVSPSRDLPSGSMATGRFLKFASKPFPSNKVASAMSEFLAQNLSGQVTEEQEREFLKKYPHYQAYAAIIRDQVSVFFSDDTSHLKRMRHYTALKNTETLLFLTLAECRYNAMFANDSYWFNLWVRNHSFHSDIPNYKIELSGGGGKWGYKSY